jgi:predicted HicB family RNase H-like nuclease
MGVEIPNFGPALEYGTDQGIFLARYARDEDGVIHGKIQDIEEDVRFTADSLETLHDNFQKAVKIYLARMKSTRAKRANALESGPDDRSR